MREGREKERERERERERREREREKEREMSDAQGSQLVPQVCGTNIYLMWPKGKAQRFDGTCTYLQTFHTTIQ